MSRGEAARLAGAVIMLLLGVLLWVGQQCYDQAWARSTPRDYAVRVLTTDALAVGSAMPVRVIGAGARREAKSVQAWGLLVLWTCGALYSARRIPFRIAKWGVIVGATASLVTVVGLVVNIPTMVELLQGRAGAFLLGEEVVEEAVGSSALGVLWLGGLLLFGVRSERGERS